MRERRGFTILELVIALLVLSVVAAMAIPAYFHRAEVTLENASILLARDLRAAQNRCAYMATPCSFRFLEQGDGYVVTDVAGNVVDNPATGEAFERHYAADGVFAGVQVLDAQAGADDALSIDARGRPTEAARITLGYRGDLRVLLVEQGSGKVTILGSTSGWTDDEP